MGESGVFIFFIRRFPDVDHLFPIIYRMAEKEIGRVIIFCQNLDYNIRDDFILNFLKEKYGITTEYSYHRDPSVFRRWLLKILIPARRVYPRVGVKLYARFQPILYGPEWAAHLLDQLKASAIIMDFNRVSKYSTGAITEVARKKNIPIILVTHGVTMRISGLEKITDFPEADYKIFPNHFKVDYFRDPKDSEDTVKILGSPRYCDEWEKIYNALLTRIYPSLDLPSGGGKLNILFFERPNIGLSQDHEAVRAVQSLDFANVVFKERQEKKGPYDRAEGPTCPSARLIQWADVVVMSISSIAMETLWQKKPLIYLKYLAPDDICVFERYGACWSVNSQAELIEALRGIHQNPDRLPYSQREVDKLFEDVVYAGDRSRDVINDYVDLIRIASKKK